MRYNGITSANAKLIHSLMSEKATFEISNYVDEYGKGEPVDASMFLTLRKHLDTIILEHSETKTPGMEFDAAASVAVHQALDLPIAITSDPNFWRWLALAKFPDIVQWRNPGKTGISKPENYGIGTIWNNSLARLWFRADIVYEENEGSDPYELAKYGDVDIWRSHILRVNTGSCRNYVRALLRFQYPDPDTKTLSTDEIRELAKKMKRLQATVALELLTEEDAFSLVEQLAEAAKQEMRSQ